MPVSQENISRWIDLSDIDYYTQFIKAWIPFNSWYNLHYSQFDSDREKINEVKKDLSNPIVKRIDSLISRKDKEGEEFRSYLYQLYVSLENENLEYEFLKEKHPISFKSIIKQKNSNNCINNEEVNTIKYFIKREDAAKRIGEIEKIEIFVKKRDGTVKLQYSHNLYDIEHLRKDHDYNSLSKSQITTLESFFKSLEPIKTIDSTITSDLKFDSFTGEPVNHYVCDKVNFKRDEQSNCKSKILVKSLIEVLYQLRNILFHGELIPNTSTQAVYKNAYFILKMLLEKIR